MRVLRLLAVAVLVVVLPTVPADAATTPSVTLRVSSKTPVQPATITVSGTVTRVRSGSVVTLQRDVGQGWSVIGRAKITAGRYSTTYRPVLGRNRLRVVVPATRSTRRATSPRRDVVATPGTSPSPAVAGRSFSTTGRLPTAMARPVRLEAYDEGRWRTRAYSRTTSSGRYTLSTRLASTRSIRVVAPRARVSGRTRAAFVSPSRRITVVPPVLTRTPTPTVLGDPRLGERLTVLTGTWDTGVALTVQWLRDGVPVPGATDVSYVPGLADVGRSVTVRVTGSKPGHAAVQRTSVPTAQVQKGRLDGPVPTVTGTPRVGERLTVLPGVWGADVTREVRWLRDGEPVPGATDAVYDVAALDRGHRLSARVTGSREGYETTTRTSGATSPVASGLLQAQVPSIAGSAVPGQDLQVVAGDWGPGVALTYSWKRDGNAIPGETGKSHRVSAADGGTRLSVTVRGSREGYESAERTSAPTEVVADAVLEPVPVPEIVGAARVGARLSVDPGTWPDGTSLSRQWLRDGEPILGQTGSTYVAEAADAGSMLSVTVTGRLAGHAPASSTSAAVRVPVPSAPPDDDVDSALRAARAALAQASTTPVDVFVGPSDSATEGYGVSSVHKRWISLFRDGLRQAYLPGTPGGFGYADLWNQSNFPDYPVTSVEPLRLPIYGLGRQTLVLERADQSVTVRMTGTDLDVVYTGTQNATTGVLSYSVDGVARPAIDTGASARWGGGQRLRIGGLPRGTHTVRLSHESGAAVVLEGVMVYDGDTQRGIRLWEGGHNGAQSLNYVESTAWAESLVEVHPDLVVLPIGSNDYSEGRTPAQTGEDIRDIIATIRAKVDSEPSIVLMAYYDRETNPARDQQHPWSEFVEMYREIAAEDTNVTLFDLGPVFGPWTGDDRGGLTDAHDLLHPSDLGSVAIADALTAFIRE